jgi:N-acetylglucosaminyl-diphospho-decaprenol L-rhamnosyltransferase
MEYSSVTEFANQSITVSVVSHGQGRLMTGLLEDLALCTNVSAVILTQNVLEDDIPCPASLQPRLRVIHNERPLGFAANHNQAFRLCESSLFAVLNPDIRLPNNPFFQLALALEKIDGGVIAPAVRSPVGGLEDSARYFPTPLRLLYKLLGLGDGRIASPMRSIGLQGCFFFSRSTHLEISVVSTKVTFSIMKMWISVHGSGGVADA